MALTFDLIYASLKEENAALREAYTEQQALIRQLVEALDDGEEHTAQCKNHWYAGCDCNKTAALTAARAWLEGKQ
jgi:hypothetical protein